MSERDTAERPILLGSPARGLRYLAPNLARAIWKRRAGRVAILSSIVTLSAGLYVLRSLLYPLLIALRPHTPVIVGLLLTTVVVIVLGRALAGRRRVFWGVTSLLALAWALLLGLPFNVPRELSRWYGFTMLEKIELTELPLTARERVLPLSMIEGIAIDRATGSDLRIEQFKLIDYDGALYWIAPETPVGLVDRLTLREIRGLVRMEASTMDVEAKHFDVDFAYGRGLLRPRDLLRTTLPNRLGLLDLFDKEIEQEVRYVQINVDTFVQVVALTDWEGLFPFAIPTFGGVFVINAHGEQDIRFYTPAEIASVPYLQGQNLLPEKVSHFYAESWTYNQGLWGWLRNRGRTEITQIPEDTNPQPFTVYFRDVRGEEGLYQFYALEPEGHGTGLSKILLFEPRGHRSACRVYYFDFTARGQSMVGPARIAETIRGSDLHAHWKQKSEGTFVISESRPYIKERDGKRTFRWFNSIVTRAKGSNLPLVVIADPDSLEVEWHEGDALRRLLSPLM